MKLPLFLVLLALMGVSAHAADFKARVDSELKPWTNLEFNNDDRNFQFVIVTDRTGGHRPGVFEEGVKRINLLQPEFVVSVGDLIEGYTEDRAELGRQWDEFIGLVSNLEMPFFYVPGNHDITNAVMQEEWDKRFGVSWYHFVYKDVLFVCLNSEDPPSSNISAAQIEYVRKALDKNKKVRWTLVFLHKPLWNYDNPENGWSQIEALLADRPHTVFAGHTHNYYKQARNGNRDYIVMATMGGGSRLRGTNFGEFDHFMWVTMTDRGPVMANLLLDGIWDPNIVTDERRAILRPLFEGAAVKNDPIVSESATFDRAASKLRLTNDADIPMHLNLRLRGNSGLQPSLKHVERIIPPNSVELVDFEIAAREPLAVRDVVPLVADWNVRYDVPGDLNPIRIRGHHRIVVEQDWPLASIATPIQLDGDLGEWGELDIAPAEPGQIIQDPDAWWGNDDGSLAFSAALDREFVYLAVRAQDDQPVFNERREALRQDSIVIQFDLRAESDRGAGTDGTHTLAFVPGQGTQELAALENYPAGLLVASRQAEGVYEAEIAIPRAQIVDAQGEKWSTIRLNVGFNDVDRDGGTQIWWRPKWGTPADFVRSGTFRRP